MMKFFTSTRVSAYLIGALLVVFTLGQLIPQHNLLGKSGVESLRSNSFWLYYILDSLGFLDIYTAPQTWVLLALFFLNLAGVMSTRASSLWARCALPMPPAAAPEQPPSGMRELALHEGASVEALLKALRGALGRGDWREGTGGSFVHVQNRYSPLGIMLFHLSFFLILVGGLMLFYTRSVGIAHIVEGQDFRGEFFEMKPPMVGDPPFLVLTLQKIRPEYKVGQVTSLEADVALYRESRKAEMHTIAINRPMYVGNTAMLIRDINIAPHIILRKAGDLYEDAYLSLEVLEGGMDSYIVPYTSLRLDFLYYPDYYEQDGLHLTRSVEPRNRAFHVTMSEGGRELWSGIIKPKTGVKAGAWEIGLPDVRYWGKFTVVKESGQGPLIAGFVLSMLGLSWMYFLPRIETRGVIQGGKLYIEVKGGMRPVSERVSENLAAALGRLNVGRSEGDK